MTERSHAIAYHTATCTLVFALACAPSGAASIATAAAPPADQARQVTCSQRTYEYELFTPDARQALPAIVLLHGAGGRSSDMMSLWRPLAI